MNELSVFFNNRIEYLKVNFPEQVVALGDWILTPVRYLCDGNKVQFLNDEIVIEKEYGSAYEKSDKLKKNYLRTAAFIVLLVPAIFLGTLVKAFGYISKTIRNLHHRVVQTLDSQSISNVPSPKSKKDAADDHSKFDQEQANRGSKTANAATKIQTTFRGFRARAELKKLKSVAVEKQNPAIDQPLIENQREACIKIQSVWRGHLAKVKYYKARRHFLSYALLEKAKPFIDDESRRSSMKLIEARSLVYFLQDPPLVIKHSKTTDANRLRFKKIREAQEICETSQYTHLAIPPARLYGAFLVEKKLPFEFLNGSNHSTKEQIGLYLENLEKFTEAVKEFTGFLCQAHLDDITFDPNRRNYDPYQTLASTPVGRYDNVPLYLENGVGKIGLIDLEEFSPINSQSIKKRCIIDSKNRLLYSCDWIKAIYLFPYHYNEILAVVQSFNFDFEKVRKDLEEVRDESLKRFKLAYLDHLDFAKEKGITLENPFQIVEISDSRKEEILAALIRAIRDSYSWEDLLGKDEDLLGKVKQALSQKLWDFLSEFFKKQLEKAKGNVSSFDQLISLRTLYRTYGLNQALTAELSMVEDEWGREELAKMLIKKTLEELSKAREIAFFNPAFGYYGYATPCIFF